ncbi:hypothetical protein SPRG_19811 [Saprolegnia parasitica CBS 223.65]|uniref:AB hydrolase-1 domain-containing protein n=1 Tax=Saprolegnia parasitica (strain CBS 223.65) TaxID=695850 RepID=A0A067CU07_SAPPC|nr:hypothetical protein SPRG_19811 [Saprolegnia parasitica CBS 223.65]KDO30262.1 hypothetical protein SPRG_19811 [Saprolegnia parasitica CBS 223.65]|eukprot:XP_012199064.1 hypothetical protein SPRG_19811 [Saprolegnia parasitica CBS 223.65]
MPISRRITRRFSSAAASYPPYGSIQATYTLSNGHPLHYTTHGPTDAETTFVLLHGAPGSHKDFRHLAPLLVRERINVIALDLPGNGLTPAAAAWGLVGLSAASIGDAVVETIDGLSLPRTFLLGHSFGGHTALEAAARIQRVHGLALLNAAGLRPHQAIRPFGIMAAGAGVLSQPGRLRDLVVKLNHWTYLHMYKFPRSTNVDDLTFGFQRFGSTDFERIAGFARTAAQRGVPTFTAIARDDHLVEKAIGDELKELLQSVVHKEYVTGGHNIQKTHAADLAQALVSWATSTP